MMKMNTVWRREDIPYDAMGDYSKRYTALETGCRRGSPMKH